MLAGFDLEFYAVAVPAVIFGGLSKSGFGSGASFVAAAILALVVDPGIALGIILPLFMLVDVAALPTYWAKWDRAAARALILGSVPGVALGAWIYTLVDADAIRAIIGTICLAFVAFQAWRARRGDAAGLNLPVWAGWMAGAVAGFTSFVSHAGGPPAAVYLLGQGLAKTTYQATTVLLFWVINLLKFVPYAFLGIFTAQTLLVDLILAPAALFGAWLGVRAHRIVPERAFFALTYFLLVVTGLRLLWVAAS